MGFLQNYLPPFQRTINIVLAAIMAALVCVATMFFIIPIPATTGYFNVGEAIIYIAAILFGPLIGGFAGGVGAAIADIAVGWGIFAPGTLVIKFLEGFVIGLIVYKAHLMNWEGWKKISMTIIAVIIGGLIMVAGYWTYEAYILGQGPIVPIGEIPFNLLQLLCGGLVAVPVSFGVQKAYPIWPTPPKDLD